MRAFRLKRKPQQPGSGNQSIDNIEVLGDTVQHHGAVVAIVFDIGSVCDAGNTG